MKSEPLVSIFIPTYQRPETLRRTLESVVAQTYKNLEVLVSNNDSTNSATNDLCDQYTAKDKRITYFRQNSNLGLSGNHNFLVSKTRGDFIFHVADDDWISNNYVEFALKTIMSDPKCAVVYSTHIFYDQKSIPYFTFCSQGITHDDYSERIKQFIQLPQWLPTGFCRANEFKKIVFTPRPAEDLIFWIKMMYFGNLKVIPEIHYHKMYYTTPEELSQHYEDLFDSPFFTGVEWWKRNGLLFADSILNDEFFIERFDRLQREVLASKTIHAVYETAGLVSPAKKSPNDQEIVDSVTGKEIFRYLLRHPAAFFKRPFTVHFGKRKREKTKV